MKRVPDKSGIVEIKEWFGWNECAECGMEYRREHLWKIHKGPFFNGRGKIRYCCQHCAPDKKNAEVIFTKHLDPKKPPPRQERGIDARLEQVPVLPPGSVAIVERGPWVVGAKRKKYFVESQDFIHDARLYINGDFASSEEESEYAHEIARRLNAYCHPRQNET